ncbi:MAG: hypothetical protein ACJAYF_002710 [Arenicella sp.]|jgi:uncharacterized protein YbdZ (MbtH family)
MQHLRLTQKTAACIAQIKRHNNCLEPANLRQQKNHEVPLY